jgi:hypothetical protein
VIEPFAAPGAAPPAQQPALATFHAITWLETNAFLVCPKADSLVAAHRMLCLSSSCALQGDT